MTLIVRCISQRAEEVKAMTTELLFLVVQIMITFALVGATSWYAYYTMKLARLQRKIHLFNKSTWEAKNKPVIWFSLSIRKTTRIHLTAVNLGGDVAINVNTTARTEALDFEWKWPCILPRERILIDLPDAICNINDIEKMKYLSIKCEYSDSQCSSHTKEQFIDASMLKEGLLTSQTTSKEQMEM